MKNALSLELDATLPDGEMLCYGANGGLLSRQSSQIRPPDGCAKVAMSPGDYSRMLEQLGLVSATAHSDPPSRVVSDGMAKVGSPFKWDSIGFN